MAKDPYVLQMDEKSICKYCGKHVELLAPSFTKGRMFYICFDCRKVFEVGVGEVMRDQ